MGDHGFVSAKKTKKYQTWKSRRGQDIGRALARPMSDRASRQIVNNNNEVISTRDSDQCQILLNHI